MDVGIVATPTGGSGDQALFEKALTSFSECMQHHGYAYPLPDFTGEDPYDVLNDLPFECGVGASSMP